MKATGIVRRMDDLGRVVIPKEIRNSLGIREGEPFEIYTEPKARTICLKPYLPYSEPWRLLEDVAESMRDNEDFYTFAADVDALARKIKESAQG